MMIGDHGWPQGRAALSMSMAEGGERARKVKNRPPSAAKKSIAPKEGRKEGRQFTSKIRPFTANDAALKKS